MNIHEQGSQAGSRDEMTHKIPYDTTSPPMPLHEVERRTEALLDPRARVPGLDELLEPVSPEARARFKEEVGKQISSTLFEGAKRTVTDLSGPGGRPSGRNV